MRQISCLGSGFSPAAFDPPKTSSNSLYFRGRVQINLSKRIDMSTIPTNSIPRQNSNPILADNQPQSGPLKPQETQKPHPPTTPETQRSSVTSNDSNCKVSSTISNNSCRDSPLRYRKGSDQGNVFDIAGEQIRGHKFCAEELIEANSPIRKSLGDLVHPSQEDQSVRTADQSAHQQMQFREQRNGSVEKNTQNEVHTQGQLLGVVKKIRSLADELQNERSDTLVDISRLQFLFWKNNGVDWLSQVERVLQDNRSLMETLHHTEAKIHSQDHRLNSQTSKIANIQRLYREVVLEKEQMLFQLFDTNKKREEEITHLKEEIQFLKSMKSRFGPVQRKAELVRKTSYNVNGIETRSEMQRSEKEEEELDKSDIPFAMGEETTILKKRKESDSEVSNDFFFEFQKSENGLKGLIEKQKQRIQELEFELAIKDETLNAINVFVEESMDDLKPKDKANITSMLKKLEIKEKLNTCLHLAEENAYLKMCMEKLSKSEVFWSKFEAPVTEAVQEKKKSDEKCLLF